MNKTGPGCKYFYTAQDRGFISRKLGGSLTKTPGRRGKLDLIVAARSGSNGSGSLGRAGRRCGSPELCSAAALHRSAPKSVLRARIRAGIGSGKISATRVLHLGLKRVSARLWVHVRHGGGGSVRRRSPAYGCSHHVVLKTGSQTCLCVCSVPTQV